MSLRLQQEAQSNENAHDRTSIWKFFAIRFFPSKLEGALGSRDLWPILFSAKVDKILISLKVIKNAGNAIVTKNEDNL